MIGADGLIDCEAMADTYRHLMDDAERLLGDHSPAAIFRRSRRATRSNPVKSRAWTARALDLDPAPAYNAIALAGMVPLQIDDRWHLAVALPQPRPLDPYTDDIEDLLLINPAANTAHVMGDITRDHVGAAASHERVVVMDDPKAWARRVALHRLEWYHLLETRRNQLKAEPGWVGDMPFALILTSPKRVRWSEIQTTVLDVPAEMRRDVQRAIFAQARLPRIEGRA